MTRAEMNWKIFRSVLPLVALVAFVYYTKSLKPDYASMKPTLITDSHDLLWRFQMNEGTELINQVVQFRGKITGFDSLLVIMDHRLICNPDSTMVDDLSIGDSTTLKGRCIGYDDLLEELRLDHVVKIMN
ncbi:MAG: hypothetical protein CM15mP64_4560 [Candidatus Neomarinimicrobiota bacterium]|nr:MAG: hypothetical protein CM15mP64_4560 [Candidatus Neomarinimicrobiota bacterium]